MDNPWGDTNIYSATDSVPTQNQNIESSHRRAWNALVDVIGHYPAVQEIFDGIGFDSKVNLSTLADAPAEVATIFHAMFGLINSHSANNRQVLQEFRGQLNDKEREIQKLRKIVENKKADISSLQQQLASASSEKSQAQLQPPPPPQVIVQQPAQPSTVYVDRPPAQDPFTGDQKDIVKRHIEYTTWKFKLVSKWSLNSTNFDSEFKKICDAINWLKGDAYNRIQSKIALFFSNTGNLSNGPWPTSASFFSELDRKYLTADIVSLARNSLNNLKMTGKLKDFPSFVSEFERLADQGELSSSMRVYHLRRKVTEPLRNAAKNHIPVPSDDDIIGWIEIYNQFWKNLEADKHISGNSSENFGVENSSSSEPKDFRVSGDPMELDHLQLRRVSVTPAEWQFRRDHGLCNRCGGDGHYSRNCSAEIAKRSKRAFDSADRELAAASRTEYRGSHRGGFNNDFNTPFPLRGGFSNSQNSRYPQGNNGRDSYSPRAGPTNDRPRLRMQDMDYIETAPHSMQGRHSWANYADQLNYSHGRVIGEIPPNNFQNNINTNANLTLDQGNGEPQQ